MKKIKLLGVIVCILLIILVFFTSGDNLNSENKNDANSKVEKIKENVGEVLNNGGSILQYDGYMYYIKATNSTENGFDNKLCRRKIDDGEEEILYYGERYKINDRLIIFNNNIFFSMVGQTYYMNLQSPIKAYEYNKGILYYIGDGKLIYAHNNNLFKATYYEKTLGIKSIAPIATFNPNYMFEDEENLYFYSNNDDGSKSIVSVNKEKQTTQILDRIYANEDTELNIVDFKIAKNYIYIIFDYGEYEIRRISKDGTSVDFVKVDSKPEKIIYTLKDDLYFKFSYESGLYVYNQKENKILDGEKKSNAPDIYNMELIEKNIIIYKNEEKWCTILENVDAEISNISIEEIKDYLYIRFELEDVWKQKEIMFYRVKKDGSNLEKLNNL